MKYILDTQLLIWAAANSDRLGQSTREKIEDPAHDLYFSVASLWEIVIKSGLGRTDCQVNAAILRRGLIDNGYVELAVDANHVLTLDALPPAHKDPFDRILVAQAKAEGFVLLTNDSLLAGYGECVLVG